ncbi:sugar transporter SemiSWEET [Oceaniferula spumae]|uniref:Sugar transporter SemiSWEET n=1 Tax=Oceaniferula spumae TaxID=2979115 RepID=A0AAT9FL64_9BACT
MLDIEMIGFIAATLTSFSFLPQVIKIWRTKKAEDLSIPAFSVFLLGVLLWLIYGLGSGSRPVIVANGITAILACGVLVLSLRYRHH